MSLFSRHNPDRAAEKSAAEVEADAAPEVTSDSVEASVGAIPEADQVASATASVANSEINVEANPEVTAESSAADSEISDSESVAVNSETDGENNATDSSTESAESVESTESADSVDSAENSVSTAPASGENVEVAAERRDKAVESSSAPAVQKTAGELMEEAYASWYAELSAEAEKMASRPEAVNMGVIDITHPHPTGAAQLYSHTLTRLSSLIRETNALAAARIQLSRLHDTVREMESIHGFAPISLSAGLISWTALPAENSASTASTSSATSTGSTASTDSVANTSNTTSTDNAAPANLGANLDEDSGGADKSDSELAAPVTGEDAAGAALGIKTAVEQSAPAVYRRLRLDFLPDGDGAIQLSPQAEVNPILLKALRENGISAEEIADLRELVQRSLGVEKIFQRLITLSRLYLPGFSYREQALIGCFHNPAQIMLNDLEALEPYIKSSGILTALAGDEKRRALSAQPLPPVLEEDRSPETERGAGDHDTVELGVVEAVAAGRSLIMDTPPGTEKFSTIAAIAADAAASGKSMIFVPASAAAGQALRHELEKIGLGELVLDFSDIEAVPPRIRTGLRLEPPAIDLDGVLSNRDKLVRARAQLQSFIADLHRVDEEYSISVYAALEKLVQLTGKEKAPKTKVRLPQIALDSLAGSGYVAVAIDLQRAAQLGILSDSAMISAWENSPLTDGEEAQAAFARAAELAEITLPELMQQVEKVAKDTGLRPAENLAQWQEQLDLFAGISASLDIFKPHIFDDSPDDFIAATASKEWRKERGYKLSRSERKAIIQTAQDMLRPGVVPADLHTELQRVAERRQVWRRYTQDGGWPVLPHSLVAARTTYSQAVAELAKLAVETGAGETVDTYVDIAFPQLQKQLQSLAVDAAQMENLAERNKLLAHLREIGLEDFLADLRRRQVPAEMIDSELDLAYTSSIFERILSKSEVLPAYGPRDIENMLHEFLDADKKHVDSLADPVLLAAVRNMRDTARGRREETIQMDKALASYGITALRDMIATYPRIMQVARPVWIVPPVVEAEYIPPMPWADLVIADTGDTSSVASLVSLLVRGRQIVLAGDVRRAEMIAERAQGEDSKAKNNALLDFAKVLPIIQLPATRVHYEELSLRALNENGYAGVYSLYPARPLTDTILLKVVDGRGVPATSGGGAVEAPKAEVEEVVQTVLRYAIDQNPDSLAVVTASARHAQEIRKALSEHRAAGQYVAQLRHLNKQEPFVVVDILQAAGLRRDNIIFSPGFGKTVHGRVLHSFGKLATVPGFIGLVEAINAARDNLFVVTSLAPGDIDLQKVSAPGPRLLAELINKGVEPGKWEAASTPIPASSQKNREVTPLLADLARRLEEKGWMTACNYGYSDSEVIPLVVGHKNIPGTWALAVLLDDASYASQASLRRRDRYRQEIFQAAGWLVYQTFSTSLFIDPAGQTRAIIEKLESCYAALEEDISADSSEAAEESAADNDAEE